MLKILIIQGISDVTVQLIYLNYYRNYQKNSKKLVYLLKSSLMRAFLFIIKDKGGLINMTNEIIKVGTKVNTPVVKPDPIPEPTEEEKEPERELPPGWDSPESPYGN